MMMKVSRPKQDARAHDAKAVMSGAGKMCKAVRSGKDAKNTQSAKSKKK